MKDVMLAVQLYSVRDEMEKDFLGTLKKVRDMGYEGVEMYGSFPMMPEKLRDDMAAADLKLVGWHTSYAALKPDFIEATIAYHKVSGCPTLVCPSIPRDIVPDIEGWKNAGEALKVANERLMLDGMQTGYHNHWVEFKELEGRNPWNAIVEASGSIIAQMDTGNAMMGNGKPMEEIAKYPGRSRLVHLKPYSAADGFSTMIGKDDTDWEALLELCVTVGGTECFIIEYEDEKNYTQLEGIKACREAIRAFGL